MIRILLTCACMAILLHGCGTEVSITTPPPTTPPAIKELSRMMEGRYSSSQQATSDSAFKNIDLNIVRIWPAKEGSRWLYSEEAFSDQPLAPFRQRIYQITPGTHADIALRIYTLPPGQIAPAQAFAQPTWFQRIDPNFLVLLGGCTLHFTKEKDGSFTGHTTGDGCQSTDRGAAYMTSEITVRKDEIRTFNRGWDAKGTQVWGPTSGPYIFLHQDEQSAG